MPLFKLKFLYQELKMKNEKPTSIKEKPTKPEIEPIQPAEPISPISPQA